MRLFEIVTVIEYNTSKMDLTALTDALDNSSFFKLSSFEYFVRIDGKSCILSGVCWKTGFLCSETSFVHIV